MTGGPSVDPGQTKRFVNALFRHANEGGFVSLRGFYDDVLAKRRDEKPFKIVAVRLNGNGLEPLIKATAKLAEDAAAAGRPVVVAPPIATFASGRASEKNLLEGLALSVELDERPAAALARLRPIIGQPTLVVASGGVWVDPETGEVHDKLHVHWRLNEPTQTADGHQQLKRARALACDLVGADATSKPVVHPMRWAGTLHRKNPDAPRCATIVEENSDSEISLGDVLSELEGLAILREAAADERPAAAAGDPGADVELLAACAQRIPNADLAWAAWNRLGMAFYRASGGAEDGLAAFDTVSRKSPKHDAAATRARWEHYATSPPDRIGAPTLVYEARKADPAFRRKRAAVSAATEGECAADDSILDDDWQAALTSAVEEMNQSYFVAMLGGSVRVASMTRDGAFNRERLVLSRETDIRLLYAHRHYIVAISSKGSEIWKGLGEAWLTHSKRRTYRQIALVPNGACPPDVFNLWRGFGIEPRSGSWETLRSHLRDVICSGNHEHYHWLLGWLAYCVQHPDKQAEVAVVLRGLKGTGKGMIGQMLMRIFLNHSLHITHSRHLIGNFNAHLADTLFVFLDEALWAGDKVGEGTLKALITERQIMIEPKGVDPFMMPNRLKILISSNNEWVVPASADERRYFVLDVSDQRKGDKRYFSTLAAAIEGDEMSAILHDLLSMDLSDFNHRNPPHTDGLNRQKIIGGDSLQKFWFDCLTTGCIIGAMLNSDWPDDIVCHALHDAYIEHAHAHGERHPLTSEQMGVRLRKLCPDGQLKVIRPRKPYGDDPRPRRFALQSLTLHRAAFLQAMSIAAHEWAEIEGEA